MTGAISGYRQLYYLDDEITEEMGVFGKINGPHSYQVIKAVDDIKSDVFELARVLSALDKYLDYDMSETDFIIAYNVFRSNRAKVSFDD